MACCAYLLDMASWVLDEGWVQEAGPMRSRCAWLLASCQLAAEVVSEARAPGAPGKVVMAGASIPAAACAPLVADENWMANCCATQLLQRLSNVEVPSRMKALHSACRQFRSTALACL